jgi:hypothetical protein
LTLLLEFVDFDCFCAGVKVRLFAVGDVAGGFVVMAEMGGTHLGGEFVLGWRAGRAAATGQRVESHHTKPTLGQFMSQRVKLGRTPIINADI